MKLLERSKVVLGYHYPTGYWHFIDLIAGPLSVGADVYSRCQIDKSMYTKFIEAPVKSITNDGVEICDEFKFPRVLTLEESIKNTKKKLESYLK